MKRLARPHSCLTLRLQTVSRSTEPDEMTEGGILKMPKLCDRRGGSIVGMVLKPEPMLTMILTDSVWASV